MRILHHWTELEESDRGACAAIGNFDGVHLGHQHVLSIARDRAAELGAPSGVITFEPHPRSFFARAAGREIAPFRLMNPAARAHRLEKLGLDRLYELPFDGALSGLEAEAFAAEVLARGLGLRHAVVGEDFCFGKGRRGTARDLARLGEELGFGTTIVPLVRLEQGEVSSTRIREALSEGRPEEAARMLGHMHRIEGVVEHGEKRGRELGFPTANMSLEGLHLPRFGVYAVRVDVLDGPHAGSHSGVASLGVRPMFGENRPNLETYLLDFEGDLYGAELSVALVAFLRDEARFDGVAELVAQMGRDTERARTILAAPAAPQAPAP
ncbi:riboflavin biosynthesis protein RibF [Brevirhabdus pacifica]|uniref:Riboflavin biosynthesis protein n=2 Tax=Brevirhabdus pacifica TaxID=1267768 RepID=A0A1U7DH00_9RHOB|nr:bifunctional riboflavin kinase/FAD synthetase [Brevirhabdus pacifica]APX89241.1 riboflavin biosynthesis protein RibF [Brevirhabdus pacifica]OWU76714.1 riboflavin biosynthesis protein RibF [Loktanella sp. 22II-4b]PJJ86152.1 FMN adenylyltransferase /riboflavin kinase [Brevirhabdus pacifica]